MTMGQIELDDERRKRLELEAGTMGEVYSPPSNTMEAINRVAMRPDDSRSNDELAAAPAVSEQHTDAKGIAKTMEPRKSQREMLADWLKEQDALLKGMTSERERVISDAEQASRGADQGRSIINSLAAGGSILAGNKDLAKGYMAQAGEMPGQQKAESDRKALAAWVAKQAEAVDSRGKLMQQAGEADERNAYLRDALAAKPPPKEPDVDTNADLKREKLKAEIDKLKRPPAPKQAAQPRAPSAKANSLPTSVKLSLAEMDAAQEAMLKLDASKPKSDGGLYDRAKNWGAATLGIGEQGDYQNQLNVAAQIIGGILEGGKLTDPDYARYQRMMPGPGDSGERQESKIKAVWELLQLKKNALEKRFEGAAPAPAGGTVHMVSGDGKQSEDFDSQDADLIEQAKKKGWRVAQ